MLSSKSGVTKIWDRVEAIGERQNLWRMERVQVVEYKRRRRLLVLQMQRDTKWLSIFCALIEGSTLVQFEFIEAHGLVQDYTAEL